MARYLQVLVPVLLSGCGLPPAVVIASYAADGVSYVATGKSVTDHGLSYATGHDCAMLRVVSGDPICLPEGEPGPQVARAAAEHPAPAHRYLVLGSFSSRANADQMAAGITGTPVTVQPAEVGGKRLHRVVAGPLSDNDVVALKAKYRRDDRPPVWELASAAEALR